MRRNLKVKAKETLSQDTGWIVLFTIIYWAIVWIIGTIPTAVSFVFFPISILIMIIEIVFIAGAEMAYLRSLMVKNNQRPIRIHRDIIGPIIRDSIKFAWAGLLRGFYLLMWSLLLFFPAIYKSIGYALTDYLIVDFPILTASEAITESRRMMRGRKWRFIWLNLRFIGWYLLIPFTLGLAYFYVKPYHSLALINFYEEALDETGYPEKIARLSEARKHRAKEMLVEEDEYTPRPNRKAKKKGNAYRGFTGKGKTSTYKTNYNFVDDKYTDDKNWNDF
ncbi:DUF975 family protein [Aerococcus viridans]|uniref:DUF975 family protein n=1 Tax=Aerococcus viridans TaxID=1377 RepID=UPI0003054105|nr:DUF975 family protein [Aerococcus viridans]